MTIPPNFGGGDQFSADPQTLRDTAPTYYHAASQITSLQQSLVSTIQLASGDMFILLEFAQLANRLVQLQARIDAAMQCASIGLNRIGTALIIAADDYKDTDQQVSTTFQKIENDTNQSNLPSITTPGTIPGFTTPGITTPGTIPGFTTPGKTPGNGPSTNPQPWPAPWIVPGDL